MKALIILAFFVCKFSNINAQHSIIGKVIIENSDTLEANVQLYTKTIHPFLPCKHRKEYSLFQIS